MKRKIQTILMRLLIPVTAVLLLTACFGSGNEDALPLPAGQLPVPLTGEVTLSCNQTCTDRGQCGTLADGRAVVLGNLEGPAVTNHNLTFPADTTAVIQAASTNVVETITNPTRTEQTFYQVILNDGSKTGWVAGWCVSPP